jgi:hypothetical protein
MPVGNQLRYGGRHHSIFRDSLVQRSLIIKGTAAITNIEAETIKTESLTVTNGLNASLIGDGTVSNTEFGYLNGVTESIASALTALDTRVTAIESSLAASIVLNGYSYQLVLQNEVYTDPGAYVERLGINTGVNADPSITTINTSSIQSYSINYTKTFQNVVLDPVTRSMNIVTLSLNLNGSATDYVAQGATYQDQGANVVAYEGLGIEEVVTTVYGTGWDLSTSTAGTKTLTYSYSPVNLIGTVSPVVRTVEVLPVPTESYIFNSSSNSFSDPNFTFADNTTALAVGPWYDSTSTAGLTTAATTGQVTWSATDGISTTPTHALMLDEPFTLQTGAYSFEIVFKFNDSTNESYQSIFAMANWSNGDLTGSQGSGTYQNIAIFRNATQNQLFLWHKNGPNNTWADYQIVSTNNNNLLQSPTNWIHLVITHVDNSFSKIYLNGTEETYQPTSGYGNLVFQQSWTPNYFMIGRRLLSAPYLGANDSGNESTRYFKYYNYELTSNQIVALKNNSGV